MPVAMLPSVPPDNRVLSRPATGLGAPDPPSDGAFRREYRTLLFENISVRFRARKGISVSCGRNVT